MMSIQNYLNPRVLKNLPTLNKQFKTAKPFPHIHIQNILQKSTAQKLHKALQKEKFTEKESDLFSFKQTDDLYFSKNKALKQFNKNCLSWEFFDFITQITNAKLKGKLDMAATRYDSCDFLLPHDDKVGERKIAYLLYLTPNFTKRNGGSFILYNSKNDSATKQSKIIPPEFNSLLLFEVSKKSFHEVSENISKRSRYAIGGWLA